LDNELCRVFGVSINKTLALLRRIHPLQCLTNAALQITSLLSFSSPLRTAALLFSAMVH
jgi:hypothetical protein